MKKIWIKICDFFSDLKIKVQRFLNEKVDVFIIKYAPQAVSVVNAIKNFSTGIGGDTVATIIKQFTDDYGDELVDKLKLLLEKGLDRFAKYADILVIGAEATTIEEKIAAIQKAITNLDFDSKSEKLTELAALIAEYFAKSGDKLTLGSARDIIRFVYRNNLNK